MNTDMASEFVPAYAANVCNGPTWVVVCSWLGADTAYEKLCYSGFFFFEKLEDGQFSKQNSPEFMFFVNETCLVTIIVQRLHSMNNFFYDFKNNFLLLLSCIVT